MMFSQNLLYAYTMKTIPAIETNRPIKKYRERQKECCLAQNRQCAHRPIQDDFRQADIWGFIKGTGGYKPPVPTLFSELVSPASPSSTVKRR
jgi:hypothetical protein